MAHRIVVYSPSSTEQQSLQPLLWAVGVGVASTLAFRYLANDENRHEGGFGVPLLLVLVSFGGWMFLQWLGRPKARQVMVTIYPTCVELATVVNGTHEKISVIPKSQIVDCIVTEVILTHKVLSQVTFRVSKENEAESSSTNGPSSHSSRAIDRAMETVPVFPRVEMTYIECLAARTEISKHL